jgi:eukaryotic-like serine/threonine-protein kinase
MPSQLTVAEADDGAVPGSSDTLVGEMLAGRYRVTSRIGSGGMGVVYAAEHVALRCQVALKTLNAELRHRPAAMERFKQEARVGALLRHPGLVRVFDFDEGGRVAFLTMEFLVGQDLKRLLEVEQALSVERAVALMTDALTGLAAAHALGIVHRDLKPANLFIESSGGREGCRLLDFGVAKVIGQVTARSDEALTVSGRPLGTLAYMAPEQIRGARDVDARADVYSACAILFEMLCGRRVCGAESPTEQMFCVLHERPPRVDAILPSCPKELADVIARGLESEPRRRFDHAAELAAALQPFVRCGSVDALSDLPRLAPRVRSRFAAAMGFGGWVWHRLLAFPGVPPGGDSPIDIHRCRVRGPCARDDLAGHASAAAAATPATVARPRR